MNTVDLSIILPVYNGEDFLERAIDSVLKQSIDSWELFLINDGSTDSTADICEKYCNADNRIHCITQSNYGLSAARNVGYSCARGRYIAYLDADDFVDNDYYQKLVYQADRTKADFIVTGYIREFCHLSGKNRISVIKWPEKLLNSLEAIQSVHIQPIFYNVYIHVWNKIYRRDFLEKYRIQFDEQIKYGEDVPYNIQNLTHARQILFSDLDGYHYMCHSTPRLTNTWRDSLPRDNCLIYRQICKHEYQHWNIQFSGLASGMYLRSCYLTIERAISCNLSYGEVRNIIIDMLNYQETRLALYVVAKQHRNLEFLIYLLTLKTRCPLCIYIIAQVRKQIKKIMGR